MTNNAASLTKYLFISKDSPLGKSVIGKMVGDRFSYLAGVGNDKYEISGKIVLIE